MTELIQEEKNNNNNVNINKLDNYILEKIIDQGEYGTIFFSFSFN